MLPKIAVKQESAFSINTNALLNGSISLVELAKCVNSLKNFSQTKNNLMMNFCTPETSVVGLRKYALGFSNYTTNFTTETGSTPNVSSKSVENPDLAEDKGHQPNIGVPDENTNILVHPNPNSKQGLESDTFDKYIEEHRFKSVETKRKRVRYT